MNKKSLRNNQPLRFLLRCAVMMAVMIFCVGVAAWGQVADGVYYITNTDDPGNLPSPNPNGYDRWYLWPSVTTNSSTGKQYVTTFYDAQAPACNENGVVYDAYDSTYCHWIVKNLNDNTGRFQLINPKLNKYIIIRSKAKYGDRDVWLDDEPTGNEIVRSYFKLNGNSSPYLISPTINATTNVANATEYTAGTLTLNSAKGNKRYLCSTDNVQTPINLDQRQGLLQFYDYAPTWTFTPNLLAAPTISDVSATNTITITDANGLPSGYTIRYTTGDGTQEAPTATTGTEYSVPITVTSSMTVKAVVVRYGIVLTEVAAKAVVLGVVAPVVTNNFDGNISLSSATSGVTIHYTTDGTDPTCSSGSTYSSPFPLGNATVIKAIACLGSDESGVTTYNVPQYDAPTISFNSATSLVTINPGTGGTAYYTTDGGTPTTSSNEYSAPFTVSSATTVKAIATHAGYLTSEVATLSITRVATPTIQNNGNNAISITSATPGATFYYTTDGTTPTTSSNLYTAPLTENVSGVTIKAIAVKENMIDSEVGEGSVTLQCAAPVIIRYGNSGFIVTCDFPATGVTIYYTTDGSTTPTTSSSSVISGGSVSNALPVTVKAIAVATHYNNSTVTTTTVTQGMAGDGSSANPYIIEYQSDVVDFISKANTSTEASKYYKVTATSPLDFSGAAAITEPFTGTFDGNYQTLTGLEHALFNTVDGGTVKNVMLKGVGIDQSGNVGAICNTAQGDSRIYNCGILPNSYTYPNEPTHSTVKGTGYTGGIVGLLDGTSRVINCFSYADITGGSTVAGIVGYNNEASTMNDIKTIVVNCMFYGDITGGTSKYPVYGGNIIENSGTTAINNYNYYRGSASFSVTDYNRSWPAAEKNLQRFEYYRSILNGNRRLCTWWVNGTNNTAPSDDDVTNVGIAKWVLDRSIAPFPVLKRWGIYPSIINPDPTQVWDAINGVWVQRTSAKSYQGKKLGDLTVTIKTGAHPGVVGKTVINDRQKTLVVTDMDTTYYDYCYGKVQLPYYNEIFGNPLVALDPDHPENHTTRYYGNYTDSVVTGWKVTAVTTDGTITDYNNFVADWETGYNYADRHCTDKDLFATNGRVFAQGGYYYVPEGVTGITIEAYWGKAFYLQAKDNSLDRVDVAATKNYGRAFTPAGTLPTTLTYNDGSTDQSISIYNDFGTIKTAFMTNKDCNVYDQAVVLLNNYPLHAENDFASGSNNTAFSNEGKGGVTLMSADLDMDNEPDFCFPFQWRAATTYTRFPLMPFRFDFLPVPELGMAMRHNNFAYAIGVFVPQGHFEITETSFIYTTQFEYMSSYKGRNHQQPLILNGGQFEQMVCHGENGNGNDIVNYTRNIIMGGHIWMKRFTPGSHAGKQCRVRHCAVSVLGGEYPEFYLSGLYRAQVNTTLAYNDSPHCYTLGGRFGIMAGAATETVKKDVVFQIDHSIIREFYGGGCNAANPVEGNILVTINNSLVLDKYCGGPKVGEMSVDKTITTKATGTHFCGCFYGGGNGGTNLYREQLKDETPNHMPTENEWKTTYGFNAFNPVHGGNPFNEDMGYYAEFEFEVFNQSNGLSNHAVARTYQHWAQFGKTRTGNITNTLNGCIIDSSFYGGGNLGNVGGESLGDCVVNTTLINDTIFGNVFAAGYSALIPSFSAHDKDEVVFPTRDAAGNVVPGSIGYETNTDGTVKSYQWCYENPTTHVVVPEGVEIPTTATTTNPTFRYPNNDSGKWYCKTTISLENLGAVTGRATITLKGNTFVGTDIGGGVPKDNTGNVYGGGDESAVTGNTTVVLEEGATVLGNVYGGGNEGPVGGNSEVIIRDN